MKFGLSLIGAIVGSVASQCSNPVLRKEIRSMSSAEIGTFMNAMRQLHTVQSSQQSSVYDTYAMVYNQAQTSAHGGPQFLPWHRWFLRNMEQDLRRIDPNVIMPYWDFTMDYATPYFSPILSSNLFGSSGNPNGYCVQDGAFSQYTLSAPQQKCLTRQSTQSTLTSPKVIDYILAMPAFADFAERIEIISIIARTAIGGNAGDLSYSFAPNDPIFFVIHTFIDNLWSSWQLRHPVANQYEGVMGGRTVTPSDTMQPFNIPVSLTLQLRQIPDLCYGYADYSSSLSNSAAVANAYRNQQQTNPLLSSSAATSIFPPPNQIQQSFIQLNYLNPNRVRTVESELRYIHTQT